MFEIGRVCMKIAGRDAGKVGVVIAVIDEKNVMLDGEVRRRKCNINHLELTEKVVEIAENADNSEVAAALKSIGIGCEEKKEKPAKEKTKRPKRKKAVKAKPTQTS